MNRFPILAALLVAVALPLACGGDEGTTEDSAVGTLAFVMNGEGFARDGFVSEDGWRVDFTHVYVTVEGPTAFQVVETEETSEALSAALTIPGGLQAPVLAHAGHPHAEIPEGSAHVALTGTYQRDVHQGPDPAEIGRVTDAPIGNYNRLNFNWVRATAQAEGYAEGTEGASIVLMGAATKGTDTVDFTIRFTEEIAWTACGPHHEDVGVLAEGATAQAELTFHFDHIFGDADEGPADTTDPEAINYLAVGFGPFASLAANGVLDVDQADLAALPEYDAIIDAFYTLGHSGEGHCSLPVEE